jgi:methylated-DNA-protein-cysteine methyltransferase-like protein
MSRSLAFQKIRQDILGATKSIPFGRVSTYADIGEHLEVMPRHVAYILATLSESEQDAVPWFRVVSKDGVLASANRERRRRQVEHLSAEGHEFDGFQLREFAAKKWGFPQGAHSVFGDRRGPYSDPKTPQRYPQRP